MRIILFFAAAILLTFTACESKQVEEASAPASETMEEATTATDIAETTAAPIDTAGFSQDSLVVDK